MTERRPWPQDARYLAGDDGSIVGPKGWSLVQYVRDKGYRTITVGRTAVRVHRIVCETFHGPAPTELHEVAHWDGDPSNNTPENLRWATSVENEQDKLRHGRSGGSPGPGGRAARGERNGRAKLTEHDVRAIRAAHRDTGATPRHLAGEYEVSPRTVDYILDRRSWKHVA